MEKVNYDTVKELIALLLAIGVVVWWFLRATDGYEGYKDEVGDGDEKRDEEKPLLRDQQGP